MKNDYDAPEGEAFDEIYQSDGLRWMSVVVLLLVVFGFFSLAWYAYRTNTQPAEENGEILVVEAEDSPYKERPDDPGGMKFPHQDKEVYNRLVTGEPQPEGAVERLLPAPEEPMTERTIAQAEADADAAPDAWINKKLHPSNEKVEILEDSAAVVPAEEVSEEKPADEKPTEEVAVEEKPVSVAEEKKEPAPEVKDEKRSEEVKVQEEIPAYVPPKPVVKPWMPVKKEEAAKVEETAVAAVDPIVAQAEKFVQEKEQKVAAVKEAAPATPKPPVAAPAVTGGVEVQLAALRSQTEAQSTWQRLSVKHGDVLAGKAHRIVAADIPGKGMYYRLRVSAGSAAAAKSLCATLSSRNQPCMVTR